PLLHNVSIFLLCRRHPFRLRGASLGALVSGLLQPSGTVSVCVYVSLNQPNTRWPEASTDRIAPLPVRVLVPVAPASSPLPPVMEKCTVKPRRLGWLLMLASGVTLIPAGADAIAAALPADCSCRKPMYRSPSACVRRTKSVIGIIIDGFHLVVDALKLNAID